MRKIYTSSIFMLLTTFAFTAYAQTPAPQGFSIDPTTSVASWSVPDTNGTSGLLEYVLFIDGIQAGTTTDTIFDHGYLWYGSEHTAGISAVYTAGNSDTLEIVFTSTYLIPPDSLEGDALVDPYPLSLPFHENWAHGNFNSNLWNVYCDNWEVSNLDGNHPPAAVFRSHDSLANYSCLIESIDLGQEDLVSGSIYLDFDLKLDDLNSTETEFFRVYVFIGDVMIDVFSQSNNESFDWTSHHLDISEYTLGNPFYTIMFRANGEDGGNIQNWWLDNIEVYHEITPGVEDHRYEKVVQVFPNPANRHFYLESANPVKEVIITDIHGKKISTYKPKGSYTVQFDTSDFAEGIYFVHIKSGHSIHNLKLMITH